eukprot:Clim_evm14s197 gene=Clim_evmTU14s197
MVKSAIKGKASAWERRFLDAAKIGDLDTLQQLYASTVGDDDAESELNSSISGGFSNSSNNSNRSGAGELRSRLRAMVVTDPENHANTALHYAAAQDHSHLFHFLIKVVEIPVDAKNAHGFTALHCAIQNRHPSAARELVDDYGADWTLTTTYGHTVLHLAAQAGDSESYHCFRKRWKVDPSVTDMAGLNAMHHCARTGNVEMFDLVLELGGLDINSQTGSGTTCLHIAASLGHKDLLEYLLGHPEVNVGLMNRRRKTALDVCTRDPDRYKRASTIVQSGGRLGLGLNASSLSAVDAGSMPPTPGNLSMVGSDDDVLDDTGVEARKQSAQELEMIFWDSGTYIRYRINQLEERVVQQRRELNTMKIVVIFLLCVVAVVVGILVAIFAQVWRSNERTFVAGLHYSRAFADSVADS